jgi:hypothetical protein
MGVQATTSIGAIFGEEALQHEREILNAGRSKLDFAEIDKCRPVLLRLSLAGNLEKPLVSLYRTVWRECGFGI